MTRPHNGGPAFPTLHHDPGMTLRDYAAVHADLSSVEFGSIETMASFMEEQQPNANDMKSIFDLAFRTMAKLRYMQADAMLRERKETT